MRRILAGIAGIIVAVAGLTGCGATTDLFADGSQPSATATPTDPTPTPDKVKDGVDPNALTGAVGNSGTTGVLQPSGSTETLPLVNGGEGATVMTIATTESTLVPSVVPTTLLDGSQRYNARVLSWQELVETTAGQQWYADGINSFAAELGFDWAKVQRFAAVNTHGTDRCLVQNNSMVIQAYKKSGLTDDQIRSAAADWVNDVACATPAGQAYLAQVVSAAPIQRVDGGFVNTWNIGSKNNPVMGKFFDQSSMIRVSLAPLIIDDTGKATALDGTRGSGVFIDCLNPHWVPTAVWTCQSDGSCPKPPCPTGMVGEQPNCSWPPAAPAKPKTSKPKTPEEGNQSKDWSTSKKESGWTPLSAGKLTSSQVSEEQKASGETKGNVTDDKVPAGTKSGDVTPDVKQGSVTAPGAKAGGDDRSDDVTDKKVTNQDQGGTSGNTEIAAPPD